MRKDFTLIIPAYNEEKRIGQTLNSIYKTFDNSIDILIVSNGSTDGTVELIKNFKLQHKNFDYLDFREKLGKGGAILEGLKKSKTKYLGFIDADDAFDLSYIKEIIEDIRNNDIIIASKWKYQSFFKVNEPFLRKIMSRVWNLLVRIFLGLNFRDTQAGAKFFKNSAFKNIDSNFVSKKFAFDIELLYNFKQKGFKIKEVYVPSIYRAETTFKFKDIPQMFFDLIKIRWSK